MAAMPDRQKHLRRSSYIIAKYTVREGKFRDVMKNICAGGLFIRTSRKIKTGQPILLEFPLFQFENIVRVSGQVIRRDHGGFAVAFDEPLEALIGLDGVFPDIVHESERST